MKKFLAFVLVLLASGVEAQTVPAPAFLIYFAGNPTTLTCNKGQLWANTASNHLWFCDISTDPPTWVDSLAAVPGLSFPLLGPTDCANPSYSFSASPTSGLCLASVTTPRLQSKVFGTANASGFEADLDVAIIRSFNPSGVEDARLEVFDGEMDFSSTGVVTFRVARNLADFTLGGAGIKFFHVDFATSLVTDVSFRLRDVTSNTFLSFTNVADPAKVISITQDSDTPSLTTTVTDGTGTSTHVFSASAQAMIGTNGTDTGQVNVGISGVESLAVDGTGSVAAILTVRGLDLPTFTAPNAATITPRGNIVRVAGPTTITTITGAPVDGQCIVLIFSAGVTVQNGANIQLDGGVDFVATADDTLSLCTHGTSVWYETGHSVN
jgi:hypothetical protein